MARRSSTFKSRHLEHGGSCSRGWGVSGGGGHGSQQGGRGGWKGGREAQADRY